MSNANLPAMKIVQFQAMPNDEHWQGTTLCLCDDGNIYITDWCSKTKQQVLVPYISPAPQEQGE